MDLPSLSGFLEISVYPTWGLHMHGMIYAQEQENFIRIWMKSPVINEIGRFKKNKWTSQYKGVLKLDCSCQVDSVNNKIFGNKYEKSLKYILRSMGIIDIIFDNKLKAMTEKSKDRISLRELEDGESLTDTYTERSSRASS